MFANLDPAAVGISSLDLEQLASLARNHNFGGIDCPVGEVAQMGPDKAAAIVQKHGLTWGGFGLPFDYRDANVPLRDALANLKTLADAASQAGCTRCVTYILPMHETLDYQANMKFHIERLKPAVEILDDAGIWFGIETVGTPTLREGSRYEFVHTFEQTLELADAITPPGIRPVGILLDTFHWYTSRASKADITGPLRDRVTYVHVNDAIAGRSLDEQIDNERALPGSTGVIDTQTFIEALREIGYDGPLTAEPMMPQLASQPADEVAAKVSGTIHRILG